LLDAATFRWGYLLGLIQAQQGDCEHAATTLREALSTEPESLPAQLSLGASLLGSGQWQEAVKLYEAIIGKHPDSADAYYGLGRVRAILNDLNGAIVSLRKACELLPNFGAAHYALGHTYERLGQRDQSVEELALFERNKRFVAPLEDRILDEISALNTDSLEALRKGEQLEREAKFEDAVGAYEAALGINARLVSAHVHLIALYGRQGQAAKAEEHFRAAAALKPDEPESYFNYGLLLADQQKFAEAGQAFRRALEINSVYPGAHLNLGYMLEAQGKVPEALGEYQKALENDGADSQAQFNVGRILAHQEKYQEGIPHLLKSLSTGDKESKPSYLYAVGAAYARSADRENGLHYLRLARQEAAARSQLKLVQSIDDDLRLLGAEEPRR
jgi:tetratricopeptide (TPR) repeat protein